MQTSISFHAQNEPSLKIEAKAHKIQYTHNGEINKYAVLTVNVEDSLVSFYLGIDGLTEIIKAAEKARIELERLLEEE